jgi:hypothetical protein
MTQLKTKKKHSKCQFYPKFCREKRHKSFFFNKLGYNWNADDADFGGFTQIFLAFGGEFF